MSKLYTILLLLLATIIQGCAGYRSASEETPTPVSIPNNSRASEVYVEPGEHDEFYAFISGGFSGDLNVYGLPSGRLFRQIPVFSLDPGKGYGFNEETKPLLATSFGQIPWGDLLHPNLSQTKGKIDGRWIFCNENNTPRIARIDLNTFETVETIEIPNSAGNHSSSYLTENTEYVVAGTRFSVPVPQKDMPIKDYKGNFKGAISFLAVNQETGEMAVDFQVIMPGFAYEMANAGRGKSHGWFFFSTYNTEEAHTLMEVNASQNDKDFVAAINWEKAKEYIAQGKFKTMPTHYAHNIYDKRKQMATTKWIDSVRYIDPAECPGVVYLLPMSKSPHGCEVDPTGEYIVGSGKLSADVSVFSFTKMKAAIKSKKFEGDAYGIPILNHESVLAGKVSAGGLGPMHTQFDGGGNAYTSYFITSEIVKWKLGTWEILDRKPTFYSTGQLMIPGGNSSRPFAKYCLAMNKITKDRYLPTGPEVAHSAQLFDIRGDKMRLLLDFPTLGEAHSAAGCPAKIISPGQTKIYRLGENDHPYATKSENDVKVVRVGNIVHIYMTTIRSHFAPDNIEGIKVGDKVFIHVTNIEQDYDVPHGFAIIGANNAELHIMPGQTETLLWEPKKPGVWPFYCTDFCSALHQEMQGYIRVSAKGSGVPISYSLDGDN
jgi:nitrous-oxide reductase